MPTSRVGFVAPNISTRFESAIRGIKQYAGPGLELVTFDPKTSISFIGREAFASEQTLAEAAELAAIDASHYNQGACACARIQFIEGEVDREGFAVDDIERRAAQCSLSR